MISARNETSTVSVGNASLAGKAKQRPDLVKQVLVSVKKEGLKATFEKVKTKLDPLTIFGYNTARVVMASLDSDVEYKPGDRIACVRQNYASHAEIVSVPQYLVVIILDNVSF